MREKEVGFKLRLKTVLAAVADIVVAVKSVVADAAEAVKSAVAAVTDMAVADVAVATVGVALATVAVGTMLAASGCARGAKSGNAKYVIVTLRGPSSMGMVHMMDSLGKASHNPFDIQIVSEPMQARKMMIDGTADFAVLPTTMGAAMYTKGLGYRLVAVPVWGSLYLFGNDGRSESATTLSQSNDGGGKSAARLSQSNDGGGKSATTLSQSNDGGSESATRLSQSDDGGSESSAAALWQSNDGGSVSSAAASLGKERSGKSQANAVRGVIRSISDLRGRRIYVMAKGMTPDLLLRYLLKQNGIDPDKDVTLDYSFPTHIDLANAVAAGRAEIGVVSEPYVSMVIQKNPKVRAIIDLSAEWDKVQGVPIAETALLGKGSVLLGNPKMVEKLIAMYKSSSNWVNANPDSAARLIVRYGILQDTTAARMAIPRSNLRVEAAESIEQSVNDYLKVFYDMNPEAVGGKMPDKDFFYYSDETTLNR